MRILLIGNFAPPYEEENLHNLTLLNYHTQEGNEFYVINIAKFPRNPAVSKLEDNEIVSVKSYLDFIKKLIRYGYRCDVIHFLTKGYTRPGLMKLMTTIIIGKLLRARIIVTLHSELFSIFGRLRSKMAGQQLLHLSFSLADKIICADRHTHEVALTHYNVKDKFDIIPSFTHIPEDVKDREVRILKKLEGKKKIIVFSNVGYPSLLFEVLHNLIVKYLDSETGIAVSLSEENSMKLQHIIEEAGYRSAINIVFIEPDDKRLLSMLYARADFVLRALSCNGKTLFEDIALSLRKPLSSGNYLYFPVSLSLIKEGDVTDLCSYIINDVLTKNAEEPFQPPSENLYSKLKEIYSE